MKWHDEQMEASSYENDRINALYCRAYEDYDKVLFDGDVNKLFANNDGKALLITDDGEIYGEVIIDEDGTVFFGENGQIFELEELR